MPDDRNIVDYGMKSYRDQRLAERERAQLRALWIVTPFVAVIAVVLYFLLTYHPPHTTIDCMAHLRTLGLMMQTYARDNGSYPDSLATLAVSKYARQLDSLICCPASSVTPTAMPTTQAAIAATTNPASCSYLYLPPTTQPTPKQILMMDRVTNHAKGKFAVALFGDGSAHTITAAQHQKILQQLNACQTNIILPP